MKREKISSFLNKIYGVVMTAAFFGGFLPLIPFLLAIAIGGETGALISTFLYKSYFKWVIVLASVAIVIGLISMYVGKISSLSVKTISSKNKE